MGDLISSGNDKKVTDIDELVKEWEGGKDTIKIGCDTNWGYATKYNYDYVVAIKYN